MRDDDRVRVRHMIEAADSAVQFVAGRQRAEPDARAWVLGFHAQQGVEKALTAVLSGVGAEYPRTDNLVMLAELLRSASCPLPPDADDFGRLAPFALSNWRSRREFRTALLTPWCE